MVRRCERGLALVGTVFAAGIVLSTMAAVAFQTRLHRATLGTCLDRQLALASAVGRLEDLGASTDPPPLGTREFPTGLPGFRGEEAIRQLEPGLFEVQVRVTERRRGAVVVLSTRLVGVVR